MKRICLGNTNLNVSAIGLGTINFGTKVDEELAFSLLDTYVSMGGNLIDTANNYAVWNGGDGGESERVIGKWLSKRNNRENVIIGTKVGALPRNLKDKSFSNMQGLKPAVILASVEQSIKNLNTDYIDILYLHVDDFSIPQYDVMKTLNDLIVNGKVKTIACSNFYSWRIESARKICIENDFVFFSAIQQRYSYLNPVVDADFYPQIALNQDLDSYLKYYKDLTLIAFSPLLKGQYTSLDKMIDHRYMTDDNVTKLLELKSQKNAIHTVLKYITNSYDGSVALITTSNVKHLIEIMKEYQ